MSASMIVTPELAQILLDVVESEHVRTSCSDDNTCNGYKSSSAAWPLCNRCLLLEVVRGQLPDEAEPRLIHIALLK